MFQENLKTYRKAKGLTQEDLAVRLHVVRQTISKWEKGLSVPDAALLVRLSEVLEVPVSQLLGAPLPGLKFLLFANTDLSYYLPSASDMAQQMSMGMNLQLAQYDTTMSLGFSVLILLVYLGCFLWIARDSFCRRDIK